MLKRLRTLSLELVFELSGDVLRLGFTFGASPNFPLFSRRIGIGNARINLSALLLVPLHYLPPEPLYHESKNGVFIPRVVPSLLETMANKHQHSLTAFLQLSSISVYTRLSLFGVVGLARSLQTGGHWFETSTAHQVCAAREPLGSI
jgi:hypothetical protein